MSETNKQTQTAKRKRIVVVGGSAAGPKAAARARRLDEHAEITILQKAPDLSMASCGYPYYVGGLFDDRLILATGATPRMPRIKGAELRGITALQSMQDADYLRRIRDEKKIRKAVISC